MKFSKKNLFWPVAMALSALCLLLAWPLVLYTVGPIGVLGIPLYALLTAVLSAVTFRMPPPRREILKRFLLVTLTFPLVLLIVLTLVFNSAWFHFPG